MSRYKIKITETTLETKKAGKEWAKVNDLPEVNYAYTPEIEKELEVTRDVYIQDTDSLDLIAVIKAVNNIETKESK